MYSVILDVKKLNIVLLKLLSENDCISYMSI